MISEIYLRIIENVTFLNEMINDPVINMAILYFIHHLSKLDWILDLIGTV
jgi:hypothetical protein